MDPIERGYELIREAYNLPDGRAQVELAEEAVRVSDIAGDVELQEAARELLVRAAEFGGYADKAIVAFTWLLGRADENPEAEDFNFHLMWQYKWIANDLVEFASISRERIEATVEDMSARSLALGLEMKPVYCIRMENALAMGDLDEAEAWYSKWKNAPAGMNSDCLACAYSDENYYFMERGEFERAQSAYDEIMRRNLRCASVPHTLHNRMMHMHFDAGDDAEAVRQHQMGWELVRDDASFVTQHLSHARFLALTKNFARAERVISRHAAFCLESRAEGTLMDWLQSALIFLRCLKADGTEKIRTFLPSDCPGWQESGEYVVAELEQEILLRAHGVCAKFDARNGNPSFSKNFADSLARCERARAVDVG